MKSSVFFLLALLASSSAFAVQEYISTEGVAMNNIPPAPPPTQNTASIQQEIAYSAAEQQEWFKGCMTTQKDQRVGKYAQEYCQCSWDKIVTTIPAKNLIAEDPNIIEATNGLLRSISSECVIIVMANHGETVG